MTRRTAINRTLAFFLAIAWTVFAAELFLRVFSPVPMLPRYVGATEFGIRGNMPNQDFWHRTPDYEINIRTNSKGIRADREIPYAKPSDTYRIVVLGDSFGLGFGIDLEDSFLTGIEKLAATSGLPIEIVNLSVSGHGTAEELLMLRNEGLKYEPDLVLLVWHATDPDNNVSSKLFAIKDGQLVTRNTAYLPAVELREFLFSFPAYRWVASNSQLYTLVREKAASLVKSVTELFRRSPKAAAPADGGASLEPKIELSLAILQTMRDEARDVGADLLILSVPIRKFESKEFVDSFPRDAEGGTFGFNVVDPIMLFRRHNDELIYWENSHGHFTPRGCELVADILWDKIEPLRKGHAADGTVESTDPNQ